MLKNLKISKHIVLSPTSCKQQELVNQKLKSDFKIKRYIQITRTKARLNSIRKVVKLLGRLTKRPLTNEFLKVLKAREKTKMISRGTLIHKVNHTTKQKFMQLANFKGSE
jgi:hypothetical protein